MSMTHSEAGRLTKTSQIQAKITAFCEPWRPKELYSYDDNGHKVRVFSAAWAEGSQSPKRVR